MGIGVLVAQIAECRAELAFLRSTWPRGSTQPVGAASDMAVATTAALTDPSSPEMTMTDTDGTVGVGAAPAPSPGEPIAPVSDGRPTRVHSVQTTSVLHGRPLSSASESPRGAGPPLTAAPHRDAGTGGSSTPRFPRMPSLATDDTTVPTASASATLAASSSLGVTVYTAAGANVTAASAADFDVEVGTGSVPTTATPPDADHISSFLSYIRRRAADDATAMAAPAAGALATHPSPDGSVDVNDGATADAASAASAGTVSFVSSDIRGFRGATATFAADAADSVTTAGGTVGTVGAAATSSPKARRTRQHLNPAGPAHAARRTAFLAVARPDATDTTYADGATATSAVGATGGATTAGDAVGTVDAAATSPTKARRKRRHSNPAGPAHAARRTIFLAGERHDATDTT